MVDLNLWELAYGDTVQQFGTHESGHPLTRQVQIAAVVVDVNDRPHPFSGGVVFGVDYARAKALMFSGVHLSTAPLPATRRWSGRLDDAGAFEKAWAAREVRRTRGAVATLANLDRQRLVYGRPRNYVNDTEKVRAGWLPYGCEFVMADDLFYGLVEQSASVGVAAGAAGGLTMPFIFPLDSVAETSGRVFVTVGGSEDTWPVLEVVGPCSNPQIEFLDENGDVEWYGIVKATLVAGEVVTIDARPWSRAVTSDGVSIVGKYRGTQLDRMRMTPGLRELKFSAADPTGTAVATIRWRDAHTSL